ncbi:MAG: hypothetical protein ABJB78_09375, partial [Betaproteobacteria bacterium]
MNSPLAAMLAAFACGVAAVQTFATLPAWSAAIALGAASALWGLLRRQARGRFSTPLRAVGLVAASVALGVGYAAWRAELRLADALEPEAENVDIRLVGIVDDLPQ